MGNRGRLKRSGAYLPADKVGNVQRSFSVEREHPNYVLRGSLDENSDLTKLTNITEEPIKIDLQHLSFMNSVGINKLLGVLEGWGDTPIEFYCCPISFVEQAEMVKNLCPDNAKIFSVMVGLTCPHCSTEEIKEASSEEIKEWVETDSYPEMKCKNCGQEGIFEPSEDLEFEVLGM